MRCVHFGCWIVGLVAIAAATSRAGWWAGGCEGEQAASGGQDLAQWNIGSIGCDTGALNGPTHTVNSKDIQTTADYGTKFNGSEVTDTGQVADVTPTVVHYFKNPSGTYSDRTLRVQTRSTPMASGSAGPLDPEDEQWWWKRSVSNSQEEPTVSIYDADEDTYTEQSFTHTFSSSLGSLVVPIPPAQPSHASAPDAGLGQSGEWRSSFALGTNVGVKVEFPFTLSASGDVDNGKVTLWMEYLSNDLRTKAIDTNPGSDWSWDNW